MIIPIGKERSVAGNEGKMKSEQKARRFKIAVGFLIFFSIFFEKYTVYDGGYSIWDIIFNLQEGGSMFKSGEESIRLYLLIPAFIISTLYLIRSLWLMKKKNLQVFAFLPMVGLLGYVSPMYLSFQPYLLINILLTVVDYMGARWLEERDEINAAYEEQKARERAEKEEQKKVRYFPGRYPEEFFRIVRKNDIYGKNGKRVLLAGGILSSACVYIMLTMYSLFTGIHGKEDMLLGTGLVQVFRQAGVLVFILLILMLTMIISCYIREQKKSMRLFTILGMRSSTVYLMFAIVFGINALLSGAVGMVLGWGISYFIKGIWQSSLAHNGVKIVLGSSISFKTIGLGIAGYLTALILALGLNQENILNLARSMNMNAEAQREKRSRKYASLLIGIGIVFAAIGILWYSSRSWAESMYIHIFSVIGILFFLAGGTTLYLNRLEKEKNRYYNKLISSRPFYYRYWKSLWNLFYLSVIHFFILAVFSVQMTGAFMKQNTADLYPYDIVCTSYDADTEKLADIAKEHNAKEEVYPMFRMTSVYGSDKLEPWGTERPIQWPQGQHIAISESTYRSLKEAVGEVPKDLNLSGSKMHVVYQQDLSVKAHTIDWDTARIEKRLRIGQPLTFYNPQDIDNVFPVWKVKSEELDTLTGTFHQGMEDNLIVFSDAFFEKEYRKITSYNEKQWNERENASRVEWKTYTTSHTSNMTEGPIQLICFSVPEKEYAGMFKSMQYLEKKYEYDRVWDDSIRQFYGKQQMMVDTGAEIFFRKLVYLFIVILLTVMGFFQYYVKLESEIKEMGWQNIFLKKLGMREKERKRALAGQMKPFAALPLLIGTCGGAIFAALTAKARLYNGGEVSMFIHAGMIFYLIYLGIWIFWYFQIKKWIWRQAEWEK